MVRAGTCFAPLTVMRVLRLGHHRILLCMSARRLRRTVAACFIAGVIGAVTACSGSATSVGPTPVSPTRTSLPTPAAVPTVDPIDTWLENELAGMSQRQKAASILLLHAPGTDAVALGSLIDEGIAGLILMGDNIPSSAAALAEMTARLQSDRVLPALIAIDEEGGVVQRLPWDTAPSAIEVRADGPAATQAAFAERAEILRAAGVNVNFGVVADVTDDSSSFIFERVLGTQPEVAAGRVAAAVQGEAPMVASTLKHFPGHGAAPGDSHESVPSTDMEHAAWAAGPAVPFAAGIDAGAALVMTGHLAYTSIDAAPASMSREWHRILREELHFDGVTVTDDMLMLQRNDLPEFDDPYENAVRALEAGGDLLLYVLPADPSDVGITVPGLIEALSGAVSSGRVTQERLDEAVSRVLRLRYSLTD